MTLALENKYTSMAIQVGMVMEEEGGVTRQGENAE